MPKVSNPISRSIAIDVVKKLIEGTPRICIHGGAGCGKTTTVEQIEGGLPSGSTVVIFDCYGAGGYLNSNSYRHRPKDAFLQLSNDLASRLHVPLLLSQSGSVDYPRAFHKRLARAAEVVAAGDSAALLVIVVDAADNSITASQTLVPPEHSFVHDIVALGDLPKNVRVVVSARTSRLESLKLPPEFKPLPMDGFTPDETRAFVEHWKTGLPSDWIEDFHSLSHGNPRSQSYAIEYGKDDSKRTLDYLRPTGKTLSVIFGERMAETLKKSGSQTLFKQLCGALVTLPRPIPWEDLIHISGLSSSQAVELTQDLAPALRVIKGGVSFADEDFEDFIRNEVEDATSLREEIARWFMGRRTVAEYAATHVANALYNAGRGKEVVGLLENEPEPVAIPDPLLRREVQLQRVQIGVRVASEYEDQASAVRAILAGAEAIKTDAAIRLLVVANPDISATFMPERAASMVLLDSDNVEDHGPLLFNLANTEAASGNSAGAREHLRQLRAWLQRRQSFFEEHRRKHGDQYVHGWDIGANEVASVVEAVLTLRGVDAAVSDLSRWRPVSFRLDAARVLIPRLIASGRTQVLRDLVDRELVAEPWNLLVLVPLAISGKHLDLSRIERSLNRVVRHRLVRPADLPQRPYGDNSRAVWLDTVLTACEILASRSHNASCVNGVLTLYRQETLRRSRKIFSFNTDLLDLLLRAHTLEETLAGRPISVETFLPKEEELETGKDQSKERARNESSDELSNAVLPLLPLYRARARILLSHEESAAAQKSISDAVREVGANSYRFSQRIEMWGIRKQASLAVLKLLHLPTLNRADLFADSLRLFGDKLNFLGQDELAVFSVAALAQELHNQILATALERANSIAKLRTVAEEKITATLSLARSLLPISRADAASLFARAHKTPSSRTAASADKSSRSVPTPPVVFTTPIRRLCSRSSGSGQRNENALRKTRWPSPLGIAHWPRSLNVFPRR
jgi:hypothetical protein